MVCCTEICIIIHYIITHTKQQTAESDSATMSVDELSNYSNNTHKKVDLLVSLIRLYRNGNTNTNKAESPIPKHKNFPFFPARKTSFKEIIRK